MPGRLVEAQSAQLEGAVAYPKQSTHPAESHPEQKADMDPEQRQALLRPNERGYRRARHRFSRYRLVRERDMDGEENWESGEHMREAEPN